MSLSIPPVLASAARQGLGTLLAVQETLHTACPGRWHSSASSTACSPSTTPHKTEQWLPQSVLPIAIVPQWGAPPYQHFQVGAE